MANIKPFKSSFPKLDNVSDVPEFFAQAKRLFPEYVAKEIYHRQEKDAFYVYEQFVDHLSFTGLVALASIEDYLNGDIVRHELTLEEKEKIMLRLLDERNAMIKPTVLTYPRVDEISLLLKKMKEKYNPTFNVCYANSFHKIWAINQKEDIEKIQTLFADKVKRTYIGDGHHRAATTARRYTQHKAENGNIDGAEYHGDLLSAYFSADQLQVHEFNRVVVTLNHYSAKGFKAELRKYWFITKSFEPVVPASKYEIGMYISHKWYRMIPKEELLHKGTKLSDKLAVSLWNREILQRTLGIKNVRQDNRVKYVEGPKGVEAIMKKVGKNAFAVGFTFYPVDLADLFAISDAQETMPPKSTFFAPRMQNGIIVQQFT